MVKICLLGPVDKRVVSYPLIKCLMFLGKTLIVTDDGVYRRFSDDFETRFSFGNSEFIVTPVIDEEVLKEVKELESSYENILYITNNEIPPECDKIVYFRGKNRSIVGEDTLEALEKIEHLEVFITFSKIEEKTALKITPSRNNLMYIYECEDMKEFLPSKDTGYVNVISHFFEQELDLPKSTIKGLMQRKG